VNGRKLRMRRKRSVARSRRRNGRCEIFARLLSQRSDSLSVRGLHILQGRAVGTKFVRYERPCPATLLHHFSEKFQSRFLFAGLRDDALEDLALLIDSPRKILPLAVDLYEDHVEVPVAGLHAIFEPLADLGGEDWAEAVPPIPDCLVADTDTPFAQEAFDVAQRKREPDVDHHRESNDFRAIVESIKGIEFHHGQKLRGRPARLNRNPSDSAGESGAVLLAEVSAEEVAFRIEEVSAYGHLSIP